ncbi:MAG: NAD(P)-dependent oxidoreductase [Sphingobium sp.]
MSKPTPSAIFPDAVDLLLASMRRLGPPPSYMHIAEGVPDSTELVRRVQGHAAVLNNESYFTEDVLARCPDLRIIIFLGTGASSYIDLDACERRGIAVRNVAGYGDRTVAEHATALMLAVYRDLGNQQQAMRAGRWSGSPLGELSGKTLGLVGLGGIGVEMAAIGKAFGMRVIGWTRSGISGSCADILPLEQVVAQADVLSLHLALTAGTKGMFGEAMLRSMKRGSVLINTARGALIDDATLVAMLEDGHLAGAGLDVFATEPLPADHPLRTAPNLVLSAHTGWQSPEAVDRLMARALACLDEEMAKL